MKYIVRAKIEVEIEVEVNIDDQSIEDNGSTQGALRDAAWYIINKNLSGGGKIRRIGAVNDVEVRNWTDI